MDPNDHFPSQLKFLEFYLLYKVTKVRGRPELSSFSQQEYTRPEGGINGRCTLVKNVDYYALHFHGNVKNQHFQSTLL